MNTRNQTHRSNRPTSRCGVAAVECAIVVPLLTLLVLGAIDVGQYANVYQKISDASRAGARVAARYGQQSTSSVETAVRDYLRTASTGASSVLASTASITVTDGAGASIPSGDLTQIPTGSEVVVGVSVNYAPVRWISGFAGLDGLVISASTRMRHE